MIWSVREKLEWRIRLKLKDGTALVGGYVGAQDGHVYVADEVTGEIRDVDYNTVEDLDTQKYAS